MKLEGRVAAITGGTRGIGRGIAEAFLAEGASVVMNGRSPDKGAEAMEAIGLPDRTHFIAGDVRQQSSVDGLIEGTVARFGRIDILVNNAGGAGGFAPVMEMTNEAFEDAMIWNVHATFWGTRRALRYMVPQGFGRIINISSVEGKHGKAGIAQYVTAKHAINGLTKSVSKEVGTTGVTCNAICPGFIITDIVLETGAAAAASMGLTFEGMIDLFAAEAAIHRTNTVEEVGAVAVLLASDAGAGITGALWSVDGGTAAY